MKRFKPNFLYATLFLLSCSCNLHTIADKNSTSQDKLFSLKVKPTVGVKYKYDIVNDSKTVFEVSDKKIINISKSEVSVIYSISKDSLGNYVVGIKYVKIHVYTKNGDSETDIEGGKDPNSIDPVEQMLNGLLASNISALIAPTGKLIRVDGYLDILNHISNGINKEDANTRAIIQKSWQQMVEQNLVKKNMSQLFDVFPDSSVHIGDKWKIQANQKDDIAFKINNTFVLNSIKDGIANVESRGTVEIDSIGIGSLDYGVNANINGEQKGDYELNINSGMPENIKISIEIEGTMLVTGREFPFTVNTKLHMNGSPVN